MAANPASSLPPSPGPHIRPHPSSSSTASPRAFFASKLQATADLPAVAALQLCSELRTRMEDTVVAMANQGLHGNSERECSCPPESDVVPLDCEECAHECDSPHCDVGLSSECTDQCVVVACSDSHHAASPCDGPFPDPCNMPCENGPDCTGLEEFFQCCPDYHGYIPDTKSYGSDMTPTHPDLVWDPALAAFLCGCTENQGTNLAGGYPNMSSTNSTASTPQLTPSPVAFHPHPQQLLQPAGLPTHNQPQVPHDVNQFYAPQHNAQSQQAEMFPHRCQWGGCFASFATLAELVGHVNLQHLRLGAATSEPAAPPTIHPSQQGSSAPLAAHPTTNGLSSDGLSCMWADCQLYPSPQSIPGPSTGNTLDSALGVLASHLLEDHLGLPLRPPKHEQAPKPAQNVDIQAPAPAPAAPGVVSEVAGGMYSPPTPLPEHDCSASPVHVCRWEGCTASYPTCNELTAHITAEHVGAGKAHYECHWEGCARHGEKGFSSKQKILRHLQSHTGHRPFQCEICGQFFSEAATLAQHKRRHTQEKPYVCDFPGCGKSFAITGALTIHKRTHNGHKPFKCSYCDRAFAESSNLSKHLRTHTGARPYPCTEPGCNKSFARPDQLARHQNVHRKKSVDTELVA